MNDTLTNGILIIFAATFKAHVAELVDALP